MSGTDPAAFLSSTLDEIETGSLTVLEWPPAASCFPSEADQVRKAVTEVVRRHQASLLTEGASGRRWLSNLVRNFSTLVRPVAPRPDDAVGVSACVIAAAGPSLEEGLAAITPMRSRVSLWVTGSALDAVLAHGLEPDLIISTDAAVYASEYLRAATVDGDGLCPIAAPLTASRGIGDNAPVWPLSHGDHIESMIYEHLSIGPTSVPAHGTVVGTAMHLALALQRWPVVVTGMDFAWHRLRSHARPHVSEIYRDLAGTRLTPPLSSAYGQAAEMIELSDGWRSNRTLQVYAHWFEQVRGAQGLRICRLLPSPAACAIPGIDTASLSALPPRYRALAFRSLGWPDRGPRWNTIRAVTDRCLRALRSLAESPEPAHPSPSQACLLRRLALDGLIRWRHTESPGELRSAAQAAAEALSTIWEVRQ
ncbi:MAG: 6-hydroxymethylpterin diphosphokinase MptE-like protein [Spirochaetia bacterium]